MPPECGKCGTWHRADAPCRVKQSDKERLGDMLVQVLGSGHWRDDVDRLAQNLLDKGVTLPPAPVDPAWMDAAAKIADEAWCCKATEATSFGMQEVRLTSTRNALRALLAAGYRVIPPTQDRAAVCAAAVRVMRREATDYTGIAERLYDAGMLVEGDGR